MTWMRGAKRHWPAAVTDTDRDMSRELNTAGRRGTQPDQYTYSQNQYAPADPSGMITNPAGVTTHTHTFTHILVHTSVIIHANMERDTDVHEAHPS